MSDKKNSAEFTGDEGVTTLNFSPEKEALLNSLLPTADERAAGGRLSMETERPLTETQTQIKRDTDKLKSASIAIDEDAHLFGAFNDSFSSPSKKPAKPKKSAMETVATPKLNKVLANEISDGATVTTVASHASLDKDVVAQLGKSLARERVAGLMLWEDGAVVCLMGYRGGKLCVTHSGSISFPADTFEDEKAQMLRALWHDAKITTRSVWVSCHTPALVQKYARYDLPEHELEAALLRDAEQSQGVGVNALVDWSVVRSHRSSFEGMVFVLPGWERESLMSVLKKAGLYFCGMSVPTCDLARTLALSRPYKSDVERPTECVLSFSETSVDIVIMYGLGNFYSRTVYSRVASWRDNMPYLYECLNDAISYFGGWINSNPISALLLTGNVPDVADLSGDFLRETGIFSEIWNPVQECSALEMTPSAKRTGLTGTALAGALGLALMRG